MGPGGRLPGTLTRLADIDLRALSETSHHRDSLLSVYLPTASREDEELNRSFVSARTRAIREALTGDIEDDFEATLAQVEDLLFHDPVVGERGRVVLACAPLSFLQAYRITVEPPRTLVLDNSPYILPLAALMDDHEPYGILLMDSQRATLYLVRSRTLKPLETASIDLMGKHKKGGMSQKRFNRLRRGAIDAFIDEIADDLDRLEDMPDLRGLVVAGPGVEKEHLVDALPGHLRDMVIGVVDVDMDAPEGELLARGEEVAASEELEAEAEAVEELRRGLFKDELAVVGLEGVREALVQGRVEVLLVREGLSVRGWICEGCKGLGEGPGTCPDCGGSVSGAELVNELVELAQRTGAEVQVVGGEGFLERAGGLGAVLRF